MWLVGKANRFGPETGEPVVKRSLNRLNRLKHSCYSAIHVTTTVGLHRDTSKYRNFQGTVAFKHFDAFPSHKSHGTHDCRLIAHQPSLQSTKPAVFCYVLLCFCRLPVTSRIDFLALLPADGLRTCHCCGHIFHLCHFHIFFDDLPAPQLCDDCDGFQMLQLATVFHGFSRIFQILTPTASNSDMSLAEASQCQVSFNGQLLGGLGGTSIHHDSQRFTKDRIIVSLMLLYGLVNWVSSYAGTSMVHYLQDINPWKPQAAGVRE